MIIRPFRVDEDARPVAELVVRAWATDYAGFVSADRMPDAHNREALLRAAAEQWALWVAERDGVVLGVTCVDGDEIKLLYVDPPRQGQGVGASLLAKAESAIRAGGHRRGRLWAFRDNARGLAFYARWGWKPDGAQQELWPGVLEVRLGRNL